MHAILTVFGKEFRENLRERRTLISALILGPLLGPLLFAGGLSLRIERGAEEGELVITSLTKEALPVIRYRTRDLTSLLPSEPARLPAPVRGEG